MTAINNFDEYCCRALSASGKLFERASFMRFLRGQIIVLQNLEDVRDEEKRGFVGLTEILNGEYLFDGDELTRITVATFDAVRHISSNFREKIIRENVLMPTYRAKEITGSGISRLSKRSGRTIREKLSSTNNLLAVRRRMSLYTGENRLFVAFLRQMEEHIELKRLAGAATADEENFQQLALKILHDDDLEEVGRWENMPPNNTLLSDRFYRQIWHGWNDLQKLSEMLKADSENLGERLCTAYFFKLLGALGQNEKFPQQPIRYDYAKFDVRPLRGKAIVGETLRLTKFETHFEIRRAEKIFTVAFEDMTQIFSEDTTELLRANVTAENFNAFVSKTAEFICGKTKTLERTLRATKLAAAKKNYMDIFATRPLYTAANGKLKRFKSRIVRQEFFADDETFDLSAEFSTALTVNEDGASKIYSLASCIHERKADNEKFNRLMQMIHENFSGSNQRVEQLSLPLPDIYNEFQLSAIRRAVRVNYNRVQTMPRSLAVLFWEMSRDGCQKFSDGDFALVVDYVRGQVSLTLAEARFDSRIERALPETRGLIWERHPTYSKNCKPEGYANFEDKLNDFLLKSGWQASKPSLDKILNVFGVKGLPLETGRLAFQFSNYSGETWAAVTEELMEPFRQIKFGVTDIIKAYLKQMEEVIGGKKVFKYIISPQLTFVGANATLRPEAEVPLNGMKFYDELSTRAQEYENATGEELPPLWTDRLPFLAIKRFYGAFELIGRNSNKKISPQFGVTQKIPVEETFTLPKDRNEYRFGLILNDSKEISYEAVVRNRAFPLREDTECELHLTYTYGKDIPYELTFKPLTSRTFREAKVDWESAAAQDYKNLPAPKFPADTETWQTLQHIRTRKGKERNALDWIRNTFRRRVIIDFERDEYQIGFKDVAVKSIIDGKPAVVQIPKNCFDGKPSGIWSVNVIPNKNERKKVTLSAYDWHPTRSGIRICTKTIDYEEVAFFENAFLFTDNVNFYSDMRVSFELRESDRGTRAANIIVDVADVKFYWTDKWKIAEGNMPYDLSSLSVLFPLHKIYSNGRSVKTPGCPEDFRAFVEHLAATLPQDAIQAFKANNTELAQKLVRIMCVMAADIGQPLYEILKALLEKNRTLFDDDLGCALGDYDRPEQQQLLMQIQGSTLETIQKIFVLNKAAWKSDGFILNVPPSILRPYFQAAIDYLKKRTAKKAPAVLKCLEFILAMFRLRDRNDDALNKQLSLNSGKVRELYDTLEDMIDEGYELPESRIELEITKTADYANKIADLYYALLICINGGEDDIKISGIKDSADEDF